MSIVRYNGTFLLKLNRVPVHVCTDIVNNVKVSLFNNTIDLF